MIRCDTSGEGNDLVRRSAGVGIVHEGNKSGVGGFLDGLADEGVYRDTPKETGDGTTLSRAIRRTKGVEEGTRAIPDPQRGGGRVGPVSDAEQGF